MSPVAEPRLRAGVVGAGHMGQYHILALMELVRAGGRGRATRAVIGLVGRVGVALFYGDGIMTPAISVLAAVEVVNSKLPPQLDSRMIS